MAIPNLDPVLSEPHRFFIVAAILAGGGKAMIADIARRRDLFGTPASVTHHNAFLAREGIIEIERHGPRHQPNASVRLTTVGDRKARAHLAALRDLMECSG